MRKIEVCPGNLTPGFKTYSPACLRRLFAGKKVSCFFDFNDKLEDEVSSDEKNLISVSGVQEKFSAIIDDRKIKLTPQEKQGRYIIKPAPHYRNLRFRKQIPANEHLTMQIARQVYTINTAENGLLFFLNDEAAYITKRFDFTPDGSKIKQEDFSSLAKKSGSMHGTDFKYTGSYEDAAALIKKYVAVWQIEMAHFFRLVVFNYLFANGDAHLKNFSLQQMSSGDYRLSPAYDLMNTSIHMNDSDFALKEGLIPPTEYSDVYKDKGHPCKVDFRTFGERIGVLPKKLDEILAFFSREHPLINELIKNSFLDSKTKQMYRQSYQERLHRFLREEKE